jgi:hypothetical protein
VLFKYQKEATMPLKGSKDPYKPKKEYIYTVKDVAELAGITRNAIGVAKAHGKVDPGDFRSVVSFLTRKIIEKHLRGDLFASVPGTEKKVKKGKGRNRVSGRETQKTTGRK